MRVIWVESRVYETLLRRFRSEEIVLLRAVRGHTFLSTTLDTENTCLMQCILERG
jgi:hypothetical protein